MHHPRMRSVQQRCWAWRARVRQENRTTAPRGRTEEGMPGYPSRNTWTRKGEAVCFQGTQTMEIFLFPSQPKSSFPSEIQGNLPSLVRRSPFQLVDGWKTPTLATHCVKQTEYNEKPAANIAFYDWKEPWTVCGKTPRLVGLQPFIVFQEIPVVGCFGVVLFHRIQDYSPGEIWVKFRTPGMWGRASWLQQ